MASVLFRTHGYAGTSVRDIARALDIQGASLYAHVTSKGDVLWSIVDSTAARFEAAADAAEAALDAGPAEARPAERLAALVRAHLGVITADPGRAGVFIREWRALTGDRLSAIAARRDAYERRVRDILEEGMTSGRFRPLDPVVTAAFLLTACNGVADWYRPDGRVAPKAIADGYVALILGAVSPTTTPATGGRAARAVAARP